MPRLIAIVGPTASGKSDLAIHLAQRLGGEVVNADSRQFYRGMNIGTAKPTPEELALVPHHLVDFLDPGDVFSLASFLDLARSLILEIEAHGRLPILAGGTGQYVWGLIEGWEVPRVPPNTGLRSQLEAELDLHGREFLADRLELLAPTVAERTDLRNPRRVIRALERVLSDPEADFQPRKAEQSPYDYLLIGLRCDRAALHAAIRERIQRMIDADWRHEVEALLESGVSVDSPAMSAIGYREMARHIRGELTLDQVRHEAIVATNRLVRHQNNWFKTSDSRIHWIDGGQGAEDAAERLVRAWMSESMDSPDDSVSSSSNG